MKRYYDEGLEAGRKGDFKCPYQIGTPEWAWWQAGWSHGYAFSDAA